MNRPPRTLLLYLILAFILTSPACTVKVVYNYADWLALWQIDHYLDLNREQKNFLASRLKDLLARHRKESLPKYEAFLIQFSQRMAAGLTPDGVDWVYASYQELRIDLFELIVADGAELLSSVDEPQIRYLERTFQEENDEIEERLEQPVEDRLETRAESTVDWLEDWLGPLSLQQEVQVTALSRGLPDTLEAWLEYRRQRQEVFIALLRDSAGGGNIREPLRAWLVFPEEGAPESYLQSRQLMRQGVKDMASSVDGMMTTRQRTHLLSELQEVIEDIRELSADGRQDRWPR